MAALRSNGRLPEPEVIANFLDGNSYSKGKLDEAFRALRLDKPYPKHAKAGPSHFKAEDIELLIQEFELTRPQAEKELAEADGDVAKALQHLIAAS
ncbi:hypothetical protein L226DRAFT_530629 [Lentinus tigrinus ALCF2SS1-7]|uniref:Nascent polypeptide-associated complex subunit alpha-like UBA domain-containing protein n=1 Tax=Lentinus tigrinus ALCF2SS1-6 TaxID=1328759 RepID=A0A5C2ST35_9APHY|nr:hypothetical protein L227DRAFT_606622 [Lentinus tigrinus ALCF2SS1-6]RPD80470.1 hypothetical protein L226DRAFT_530629 [Lentinus tigrinus ALCF2SS1-7]